MLYVEAIKRVSKWAWHTHPGVFFLMLPALPLVAWFDRNFQE